MRIIVLISITCIWESLQEEITSLDTGDPIVTIDDGRIRGRRDKTAYKHKPYIAFQGIPYAQPPIGKLRFSPPEKSAKWGGTLNAIKDKSECVQSILPVTGSEDCLYVNVYTPSLTEKKVVMIFIHGGGFYAGSGSYSQFPPDGLLEEDVVYVSFNYRLGVFGFFSTLDTVAPGNLGLKDQCLALKWVYHNIRHFGGDPDKITVFGQSAGAGSVSYQLLSNCAKGTYQKAILESGSALSLWAVHRGANETAHAIAKLLQIESSDPSKILEGLRKVDYKRLQQAAIAGSSIVRKELFSKNLRTDFLKDIMVEVLFGPVIEPHHSGAFFSNYSEQCLSEGRFNRVPVIMGVTSNEAAAVIRGIPSSIRPYLSRFDQQYELLAPADLTKNLTERREAASAIKSRYFGVSPISLQTDSVVKFLSDNQFNRPVRKTALDMGKYVPVYFYVFSYEGKLGGVEERTVPGVGHVEELGYLFPQFKTNVSASDKLTSTRIIRLWTNFAKFGNPTPRRDPVLQNVEWTLSSRVPSGLIYLNISEDLEIGMNPFNENMKFYDKIYKKYGQPPHDTY